MIFHVLYAWLGLSIIRYLCLGLCSRSLKTESSMMHAVLIKGTTSFLSAQEISQTVTAIEATHTAAKYTEFCRILKIAEKRYGYLTPSSKYLPPSSKDKQSQEKREVLMFTWSIFEMFTTGG